MNAPDRPVRLLHAFSTFELGGPQSRFVRLVEALGSAFEHHVLAMDANHGAMSAFQGASPIRLVAMTTTRGRNLDNVPRMIRLLRSLEPDRLLSYNFGAVEWSFANALVRVPHVHVEEGFGPAETERRLFRRSLVRMVGLRADAARVVTVSSTIARIARAEWKVPASRLSVVPNGVDIRRFPPASGRTRPSRFSVRGELVIGTIAGLRREKRVDRLIEAVGRVASRGRPVVLVVAGDGPERASLQALATHVGLQDRSVFLGQISDPATVLQELDLFCLSSDTEQMPLSLVEAMASALPVVATDVGDVAAILGADCQAQMAAREPGAFADRVEALLEDPVRRQALGIANRARVSRCYTQERMVANWRSIWSGQEPGRSA